MRAAKHPGIQILHHDPFVLGGIIVLPGFEPVEAAERLGRQLALDEVGALQERLPSDASSG